MKSAESNGCPATALDGALLSKTVMPLVLLLGSGPPASACGLPLAVPVPAVAGAPAQEAGSSDPPAELPTEMAATTEAPTETAPGQETGLETDPAAMTDVPETSVPPRSDITTAADSEVEPPQEGAELATNETKAEFSGYVNVRTRSRWAEHADEDDHDLYGVVGADYITGGPNSWGIHVLLRGSWGVTGQDPDSIFYSVQDTFTNRFDGRIYHAYADAPVGGGLEIFRFGRMAIYDTPASVVFDGAQVETAPNGPTQVIFGAYGGMSVRQFEDWPSDAWMGGLYTRFRPWVDGEIRIDWMRLSDDQRYGEGDTDLVSGWLLHRVTDDLRLEGNYTMLDGKSNDMRLKGFWAWPEQQMTVRASYYELLEEQNNLAFELNPYYNILRTYSPYAESQLVASKMFGETFELLGGLSARRVDDVADIGRFNRDYDRYYATAAFPELLPLSTTLSLTGEVWDSPNNDIQTWGLDLTSRLNEDTDLSLGSYYSLYKYFFDIDTEREDVRTFYVGVKNTVSEATSLMVRYEYESEEIDSFHNLRFGVTWRF